MTITTTSDDDDDLNIVVDPQHRQHWRPIAPTPPIPASSTTRTGGKLPPSDLTKLVTWNPILRCSGWCGASVSRLESKFVDGRLLRCSKSIIVYDRFWPIGQRWLPPCIIHADHRRGYILLLSLHRRRGTICERIAVQHWHFLCTYSSPSASRSP